MKIIDFHTHILPNADHGSDSIETTLKQLELSKLASVDTIIATPHFYPHMHRVEDFLQKRKTAYETLKKSSNANVILGAEVLLCEGLNRLKGLETLTIGNSRLILLELPFSPFKREYENAVEDLISDGYDVILAHADRYQKENIERLIPLGVKLQLNASSLSGIFTKKHLINWIDKGLVVGLGSDIHMADKKAYASYSKARGKLNSRFDKIMQKSNDLIFGK